MTPVDLLKSLFQPRVRLPKPGRSGVLSSFGDDSPDRSESELYYERMIIEEERLSLLRLYDELDRLEDVSAVLDAHAEEATIASGYPELAVRVEGSNQAAVDEITKLFAYLEVEDWATTCVRDLAKNGDDFARLDVVGGKGIVNLDWRSPMVVIRQEDSHGNLKGFQELKTSQGTGGTLSLLSGEVAELSKPWAYVHFRRRKLKMILPKGYEVHVPNWYGTALLWRAGKPGRRLEHLRDILMLYRIQKTLDRHIYKVDVGAAAAPEEALATLKRWKRALKRRIYRNDQTGEMRVVYDPTGGHEDIFWPTGQDSSSSVDVLQGQPNIHSLADVDLLIAQLFSTLRAPAAYFGYDINSGSTSQNKSLGFQDIRWGRAVAFSQRAFRQGLARMAQIHLAAKGLDPSLEGFSIVMTPPSNLDRLQRLETDQTIVDVADRMLQLGENLGVNKEKWAERVMKEVMGLADDEIKALRQGAGDTPDADADDETDFGEEELAGPEALHERRLHYTRWHGLSEAPAEELPSGPESL